MLIMGSALSTSDSRESTPHTVSHKDATSFDSTTNFAFSVHETNYLLSIRRLILEEKLCQNQQHCQTSTNLTLIASIWKYSHKIALTTSNNDTENEERWIEKRCQQMKTIFKDSSIVNESLNNILKKKILIDGENVECVRFLEFLSKMFWRNGREIDQLSCADFLWDVCCDHYSDSYRENLIPAKNAIDLCVQLAIFVHYMHLDHAFEMTTDGSAVLIESRNISHEQSIIEVMTNSLLEYVHSNSLVSPTTYSTVNEKNDQVNKNDFSQWQTNTVPDLMHCSLVQFFRILFFPPIHHEMPLKAKETFLKNYDRPFPLMQSSKECLPPLSSKLKKEEVLSINSPVFGRNYILINDKTIIDGIVCVASTSFSPSAFLFTSLSSARFGAKWYRLFSGAEDGWSFHQLEKSILGYQGPTLIVIQASSKHNIDSVVTLGAYTASKWEKNKRDFFGTADCFLFSLKPTLRILKALPKMGSRGGHYMYFHSNSNVTNSNPAKKDDLTQGLGFGGTLRSPRLFIERNLEECWVSSQDTSFDEGHLGFNPSDDPFSSAIQLSSNCHTSSLHIESLEIYCVGDIEVVNKGFQAQYQHRDIAEATLRNARTVDKAAFLGDMRNGVIETKAFAHRAQVDGRAHGAMKE